MRAVGTLFVIPSARHDKRRCRYIKRGPLRLRFDRNFGLHRIRNETLLVRGMIHFLNLLRSGLLVAGELQSLV